MVDELYLEPSRKAQIVFLLVIILAALLFASINPFIDYLTPSQGASSEDLKAGARLLASLALVPQVIVFLIMLFWAAYFGRRGYRTIKFGIFPPVGSIVIWRTKIRTGEQANLEGRTSIFMAVCWGLFALLEIFKIWSLAKLLSFTFTL
ncbi:MAG: hypothetical protein ABL902_04835 [Gallionella sp.]